MSFLFINDEPLKEKKIMISNIEIKKSFENLLKNYGKELAGLVEKIYRLETNHFKSVIFKNTLGAGLLWNDRYFKNKPKFCVHVKPFYKDGVFSGNKIVSENEPGAKKFCYVVFNNLYDGLKYVADYLIRHKKDDDFKPAIQRWGGSSDYVTKILNVKNQFII